MFTLLLYVTFLYADLYVGPCVLAFGNSKQDAMILLTLTLQSVTCRLKHYI